MKIPKQGVCHSGVSRMIPFLLPALLSLAAHAQTPDNLSDASVQGSQLVQKILSQIPANNSSITGILQIRDGNGSRISIPVTCSIIASPSKWECIYQASWTNRTEVLWIHHEANAGNHYYRESNPALLSPDQLVAEEASAEAQPPLTTDEINHPFAGSDFCVADLGLEFFQWPQQKVLRPEIHRSRGCTVLESTNPHPSANSYARVVSWVDTETLGIVEAYAYDTAGRKLKDFYPKDFKKVDGQWQVQTLVIENLESGSRSRLEFDLKK